MRLFFFFLFFSTITVMSYSQSSEVITGMKAFGGFSNDDIATLMVTQDSGYVFVGSTLSTGAYNSDVLVIRTDSHGDTLWAKAYGEAEYDAGYSICDNGYGGFIVSGQTRSYGATTAKLYLLNLTAEGDTIWTKVYDEADTFLGKVVKQTSDSGYAVLGYSYYDIALLKIDSEGLIEWYNKYDNFSYEISYSMDVTSDDGFIVAGAIYDNYGYGYHDISVLKLDSLGQIEWQKTYGGENDDYPASVLQTSAGEYFVAGSTKSFGNGNYDIIAMKLTAAGDTVWTRTYGGINADQSQSAIQTNDGGFLICGNTSSVGLGDIDGFILRLDNSGNQLWTSAYGASNKEYLYGIGLTPDGGIIAGGKSRSFGAGGFSTMILKTDIFGLSECNSTSELLSSGFTSLSINIPTFYVNNSSVPESNDVTCDIRTGFLSADIACDFNVPSVEPAKPTFEKIFGETDLENANSIIQTYYGGYLISGFTSSFGQGSEDGYLVAADKNGDYLWSAAYGGIEGEDISMAIESSDGTLLLCGTTDSYGEGYGDILVMRTSNTGIPIWSKTFGGLSMDEGKGILQCSDGNYLVYGNTYSFGAGAKDICLIKIDSDGEIIWTQIYGGTLNDEVNSVKQRPNNGFLIGGSTASFGAGGFDILMIKTDSYGNVTSAKTIGDTGNDYCTKVISKSGDGYIYTGYTDGFGSSVTAAIALKSDFSGNVSWMKAFDGPDSDRGFSIFEDNSNGFVLSGMTRSFGAGIYDGYVVRMNNDGDTLWTRTYGADGFDRFFDGINTSDGNFAFTGRYYSSFGTGTDVMLLKTDTNGYGGACITGNTTTNIIDIVPQVMDAALTVTTGVTENIIQLGYQPCDALQSDLSISIGINIEDVSCSGGSDGNVNLSYEGSFSPYEIIWSDGSTNNSLSSVSTGNYFVTLTDGRGCQVSDSAFVNEMPVLEAMVNIQNVSCNGFGDGSAAITASGGTPPYSYLWSFGQTGSTANGLFANLYSVNISDSKGCLTSEIVTITEPDPINIDLFIHDATCNNADGYASATISGGTTPYDFLWSGGETGDIAENLPEGSNVLSIIDGNACVDSSVFYVGTSPLKPEVCLVLVDPTTDKNLVVWEKPEEQGIQTFNIYKEITTSYWEFAGSVDYNANPVFTDYFSDPRVHSDKYKLTVVDSCGNESEYSDYHRTINLTVSENTQDGGFSLIWNHYVGFTFDMYKIYRGSSASTLQVIDSVSYDPGTFIYNDVTALQGVHYVYQVVAEKPDTCFVNLGKAMGGPYSSSFSNLDDNGVAESTGDFSMAFSATPRYFTAPPFNVAFENEVPDKEQYIFYWNFGDSNTSMDVSPFHTYQENGLYTVTLIAEDISSGQKDTLSKADYILCTGADGISEIGNNSDVMIYPNPSDGMFAIEFQSVPGSEFLIQIFDKEGRLIVSYPEQLLQDRFVREYDISSYREGVYMMRITGKDQVINRSIIVY